MFYCSYNSKTRAVEGKKHVVRDSEFHPNEKTMLLHLTPFSAWRDESARPKPKKWVHKRTVDIGTSTPVFVLDGNFEIWCEEEGRYLSPREVEAKGYFMNHGEIMEISSFPYGPFHGWEEHEGEFEVYMPLGGGGWMRVRTKTTERKPSLIEIIWKYDGRCEEDRIACLAEVRAALKAGADVNEVDNLGFYPLHIALMQGLQAVVPLLLEAGADIDTTIYKSHFTPLYMSCISGNTETIKMLLKAGANTEIKDHKGRSPLACTAYYGFDRTVQLLLEAGADIEARDEEGKSPLALAAQKGKAETVQILINAGANIEARDNYKRTPLICAVYHPICGSEKEKYEKTVQLLLDAGADVNAVDSQGLSPLRLVERYLYNKRTLIKILEEAIQKKNSSHEEETYSQNSADTQKTEP